MVPIKKLKHRALQLKLMNYKKVKKKVKSTKGKMNNLQNKKIVRSRQMNMNMSKD